MTNSISNTNIKFILSLIEKLVFLMKIITKKIHDFLHFFHNPFSGIITRQQFRYIACGGFMAGLDVVMYFVCYNFILNKNPVHLGQLTILSHVAALWIPFPISFLFSFLLSRYVVFSETNLKKTTSLIRYIFLVIACIFLNIMLIKFFVEVCHFYATLSKIICTILIAGFSYISQKYFTFKITEVLPS